MALECRFCSAPDSPLPRVLSPVEAAESESQSAGSESNPARFDSCSTASPINSAEPGSNAAAFHLTSFQSSAPHPTGSDTHSARSASHSAESQLTHSRSHSPLSSSITPLTLRKQHADAQGREGVEGGAILQCPCSSRYLSTSRAAMHPVPAAVTACRYRRSCTSPQAKTPGTRVKT